MELPILRYQRCFNTEIQAQSFAAGFGENEPEKGSFY